MAHWTAPEGVVGTWATPEGARLFDRFLGLLEISLLDTQLGPRSVRAFKDSWRGVSSRSTRGAAVEAAAFEKGSELRPLSTQEGWPSIGDRASCHRLAVSYLFPLSPLSLPHLIVIETCKKIFIREHEEAIIHKGAGTQVYRKRLLNDLCLQ